MHLPTVLALALAFGANALTIKTSISIGLSPTAIPRPNAVREAQAPGYTQTIALGPGSLGGGGGLDGAPHGHLEGSLGPLHGYLGGEAAGPSGRGPEGCIGGEAPGFGSTACYPQATPTSLPG